MVMDIDYAEYREALEETYEDVCTISGYRNKTKPNGGTVSVLTTLYTDQPCRLSQMALGTNGQTETVNQVAYETKLFISPDVTIEQGDNIEVTHAGHKRLYSAGEPFPYPTHQEVSLERKGKA
jgi:hypothetical protein